MLVMRELGISLLHLEDLNAKVKEIFYDSYDAIILRERSHSRSPSKERSKSKSRSPSKSPEKDGDKSADEEDKKDD